MKTYTYLIVGGGMTADAAVKGIRQVDEAGTIGVLAAEPDPPYRRPPLTKDLWTKDASLDDIWCATEAKGAEVLRASPAVKLDVDKKQVFDDKGTVHGYQRLLLATGGEPRRLPFDDDHQVIYYRTCGDYRKLRALAKSGQQFAVFGGGFIGAEIAAALAMNGKDVTMVFPESCVAGRMLPAELGIAVTRYYESRGVKVLSGCKPSSVAEEDTGQRVLVEDGRRLSVEGVVAGIGISPNTRLAEEAGLKVDNGIVVDAKLRTGREEVFAAGDVANFHNALLDCRMRVEHEDNALTMGNCAGRNMAGEAHDYDHLPFFYSDLFDVGYEAVGETDPSLDTICGPRDAEDKGVVFYMKERRVRGVLFWNLFDKVEAGRELIAAPGPHSKDGLKAWAAERLSE